MKLNPFILSGYKSPEYFCDRQLEAERILSSLNNQRNLTLMSSRRMGKTGLIFHVLNKLKEKKEIIPVYIDILGTISLAEFIENFGNALIKSISKSETSLKKILKSLAHLRPQINFNSLTGEPKISFDIRNEDEINFSLETLFELIGKKDSHFFIVIDEFQQIANYSQKNTEAILRTYFQQLTNATFLFSGSKRHILSEIFTNPSRPFFSSSEIMDIRSINEDEYKAFINFHFHAANKGLSDMAFETITEYTELHTFYTQFLCNRLFELYKNISRENVQQTLVKILQENEPVYANYLNLLTNMQYRTLRAISMEKNVKSPNAKEFLQKYKLGAASSVSQAIDSLKEKEFINFDNQYYSVQDKFLREWIRINNYQ